MTDHFYFLLLLVAALLGTAERGLAQESEIIIAGLVTDADTGESLPGVNVYLSGTTIGVSTGLDGRYKLVADRGGAYDLVFSMIGYQRRLIAVELLASNRMLTHDVELQPKVYELGKLEVRASNEEWKKNYAIFKRQFLGVSSFARQSAVRNPWVMEFRDDEQAGFLRAQSSEPLHLVNRALGYEIYVEVVDFRWARNDDIGYYTGYPRFVPMEPEDNRERRRWERNREESYQGSPMHFFRSLYRDKVNTNRFTLGAPHNLIPLSGPEARVMLAGREGITPGLLEVVKGYQLLQQMSVEHGRSDFSNRKSGGSPLAISLSAIIPNRADKVFFIDDLGNLVDPTSLVMTGDWAGRRMADRLPMDYGMQ